MIRSCLQGVMGKVYTVSDRTSAAAVLGDFCFFSGKPDKKLILKDYGREFLILVPPDESWAALIQEALPASRPHTRTAFRKEADFDREKLQALLDALPREYRIQAIDDALYRQCLSQPWSRDLVSNYESREEYRRLGVGFAVLRDGEILSGASAYSRYREGIEIEIDTREDCRHRGLAAVWASALILHCLEKGLFPSWDAHNPISAALAEKLGYIPAGEYTVYELHSSKA